MCKNIGILIGFNYFFSSVHSFRADRFPVKNFICYFPTIWFTRVSYPILTAWQHKSVKINTI